MLSFREFKDEFIASCRADAAALTGSLPCGTIEIEERDVTKAQYGKLSGIIFRAPDTFAAPTYYVEDFYGMYRNGTPIEQLSSEAVRTAFHYIHEDPPFSEEGAGAFEEPANLRVRLINREVNGDLLTKVPHRDTGCGLALIAEARSGEFRAVITREMMDSFSMTEDDLMYKALLNAAEHDPAVLTDIAELVCCGQDNCTDLFSADGFAPTEGSLYVLSNSSYYWGASVLFYPGMTERLAAMFGGDFYVLPSSVHEVLILKVSGADPETLASTIHEGNRTVVSSDEFLSDDLLVCRAGIIQVFQL